MHNHRSPRPRQAQRAGRSWGKKWAPEAGPAAPGAWSTVSAVWGRRGHAKGTDIRNYSEGSVPNLDATGIITAASLPLAVIAIVANIKKSRKLGSWTLPVVALIGLMVGVLDHLYGSSELYRDAVAWMLLALAGSGAIDLKKARSFVAGELTEIKERD